jgi:hypothetical protein
VGILKHQGAATEARSLAARSLVGRAPGCLLRLADPSVSAEHASIFWSGERWEVRDLASRNGTFVDGVKVEAGKRAALREGAAIVFGGDAETWILECALPPVPSARRVDTGELRVAEDGLLVLPDEAEPTLSILEDATGGWMLEDGEERRAPRDQEVVTAGGSWRLSVPPAAPEGSVATTRNVAREPSIVAAVTLSFAVSRDEEHVEVSIAREDGTTALVPRSHHYLLLTLARARLAAEQAALPPEEQGWLYVDELLDMLKIDATLLSVYIYRNRKQLAAAGVQDAGAIIERRPSTRQIRLGASRVALRMA